MMIMIKKLKNDDNDNTAQILTVPEKTKKQN